MRDRRAAVFLIFAAACLLLTPVAEPAFRWVSITLGAVYVVLAVASALDAYTRSKR